ncbi:sugar transferase [Methylophilaceae bacterium]|nr:sugar transferase [Methylophilaceae bacterium]
MKRFCDLVIVLILSFFLIIPMLVLSIFIFFTSKGNVIYWSQRVGQFNHYFNMPKFRTMRVNTPTVATHLLKNPDIHLTPIGSFLRKSSLDELPQLWSVLKGDMSLVGPRPALFNQDNLITLRKEREVDKLKPGITGWAQVNGRDELSISDKVALDVEYLEKKSFCFDMKILWITLIKVTKVNGVSH